MPGHYDKKDDGKMSKKDLEDMKKQKKMRRKKPGSLSPWIAHVKKVAKQKKISYKEALKVASKSYGKKK